MSRLPPGGHHRGDREAPHGPGASPRERHGGAPQPPAAASSSQRPGLRDKEGSSKMRWGARLPQIQGEWLLSDFTAWPSFLAHGSFYAGGPRSAAAPSSAPHRSPRRRRRCSLLAPRPPLPSQPRRQPCARSRTAARRRRQNTYRSAGRGVGGRGPVCAGALARRRGLGRGCTGVEAERGPLGPGTCTARVRRLTGRAGGGEQESVGEVLARERGLAGGGGGETKFNIWHGNGIFFFLHLQSKESKINQHYPPSS